MTTHIIGTLYMLWHSSLFPTFSKTLCSLKVQYFFYFFTYMRISQTLKDMYIERVHFCEQYIFVNNITSFYCFHAYLLFSHKNSDIILNKVKQQIIKV